jgi:hypothetical protein
MSGGQHRGDEANGPSRSGEREAEGRRNRKSNQPSAAAQTRRCAQDKQKPRRNVLDETDFVRDVVDSYPRIGNCHSETMQLPFDDRKQPSVAIDSSIGSLLMGLSLPKGRSFHSVGLQED